MDTYINNVLKELGIPANLHGYRYLKEVIKEVLQQKDDTLYICKLYTILSKRHNTKPQCIERSIRKAIEVSMERGNIDMIHKLFRHSYSSERGKPTNSEFVATLAEYIRPVVSKISEEV